MTDRDLLATAASLLLGERWQVPLSRLLSLNPRHIRRWVKGERAIPARVFVRLRRELVKRREEIGNLLGDLPDQVSDPLPTKKSL